jgi:hypothetical protein
LLYPSHAIQNDSELCRMPYDCAEDDGRGPVHINSRILLMESVSCYRVSLVCFEGSVRLLFLCHNQLHENGLMRHAIFLVCNCPITFHKPSPADMNLEFQQPLRSHLSTIRQTGFLLTSVA